MMSAGPLSGENRELSCFAHLTHLLSHRSLDELLADALALLINTFRASGGSMLYASSLIKRVRQGSLSAAAQSQVDYLEEVALARTRRGAWQIQLPSTPPVTKHALPDLHGALFSVPLINRDRACGVVSLFMPLSFDLDYQQRQEASLLVGSISAIASTVEQLEINRLRLSQLGLFYQMGQAMTSTFDTGRLFEETIDLALAVIDARYAALMLLDQERQQLRIVVRRGDEAPSQTEWVRVGQGVAGWVAEHGEPVLLNDVSRDERFDAAADGLQQRMIRSLVCVPLQIKGKVIGILHVLNKRAPFEFDEEDLSLLITLGAQVSIAIDNARLYNSLRAERDRIIEVQESTRHELARNLHDGPVQLLAAIAMQLEYLERLIQVRPEAVQEELNSLRKLVRQAIQDARMLLFELRPVILETQGLIPALQSYVERLSQNERFAPHFDPGNFEDRLNVSVAATIFSIVQEAINNIEKHAKADNVWIRLREQDGELIVFVEDDGKGFNVDSVMAAYDQGSSFGLLNMKERAELIDGVITMESGPKRGKPGTLVQLRVPLTSAQEPVDV